MEKSERSSYTALDFMAWSETQAMVLAPKFQRRGVWSTPARSYFIDSLIRGMPVPPLYLRVKQSEDRTRIIREVVDGQQRIAAVLDFINGKYSLSRSLGPEYGGKRFEDLEVTHQDSIREFSFICEILHGVSDAEVLEIFARLNTYSVQLNRQELRNGTYFGQFKQSAYSLAHEHLEFWRRHKLFTERGVARMSEVELTSELITAQIDGLQDKKKSIDRFYAKYDEEFKLRSQNEVRFRKTIDAINDSIGDVLKESAFNRPPLFYSLYCAVFHRVFGLPNQSITTPKKRLTADERHNLKMGVLQLSEKLGDARRHEPVPEKYSPFVAACLRQTDNLRPRQTRLQFIYSQAF